jgi:hypothetical protein
MFDSRLRFGNLRNGNEEYHRKQLEHEYQQFMDENKLV